MDSIPISMATMRLIVGGFFLLIGIAGGGFTIKELQIPVVHCGRGLLALLWGCYLSVCRLFTISS